MADDEYLELLKKIGRRAERRTAKRKAMESRSGTHTKKSSNEAKPSTSSSSRPSGKQPQPKREQKKDRGNERKETKRIESGPKRHTDISEALKGIPRSLTDTRRKENRCMRCGGQRHSWPDCYGRIMTVDPKVAAAQGPSNSKKRKASEEPDKTTKNNKKSKKTAPVAAAHLRTPRSPPPGRILEISSDSDTDMDVSSIMGDR